MERSDAVNVILARIMKMMGRSDESPRQDSGSLDDFLRLGEPIPLRARRGGDATTQGRDAVGRDRPRAVARRAVSRR